MEVGVQLVLNNTLADTAVGKKEYCTILDVLTALKNHMAANQAQILSSSGIIK